jgi:excisionase family DNA binding protein
MDEELLLTPDELCTQLKIRRATAQKMLASGELPSIKIGRLRRIPAAGLRAWLEHQVSTQTAEKGEQEPAVTAKECADEC